MSHRQKQITMIGAGALVLILIYRWYQNQSAASGASVAAGQTATDAAGAQSDYAALAGQEQADVAGLQQQNAQLLSQEQSDVASLASQEQADVQGLSSNVTGLSSAVSTLTDQVSGVLGQVQSLAQQVAVGPGVTGNVAAVATGSTPVSRSGTITTHAGGPFFNWFKSIYGKAPPSVVSTTNPVYVAWTLGVPRATVKTQYPKAGGIL